MKNENRRYSLFLLTNQRCRTVSMQMARVPWERERFRWRSSAQSYRKWVCSIQTVQPQAFQQSGQSEIVNGKLMVRLLHPLVPYYLHYSDIPYVVYRRFCPPPQPNKRQHLWRHSCVRFCPSPKLRFANIEHRYWLRPVRGWLTVISPILIHTVPRKFGMIEKMSNMYDPETPGPTCGMMNSVP